VTRFLRTFARSGRDSDLWPIVILLLAVLVPAVCLLWFMGAAMRNERFAARQKLTELYRRQLFSSQTRLERYWKETATELENLARTAPAAAAFANCIQSGLVDSVAIFDGQGSILYPNTPAGFSPASGGLEMKWADANRLEYLRKDFIAAAGRYEALSNEATNVNAAARALQAQARCLMRAGRADAAIRLVNEVLSDGRYAQAADPQGRLIVANAELMVLELVTNNAPVFQSTVRRLQQRLMDYENPALAASQRLFLMKALKRLSPQIELPTLAAEELAAEVISSTERWPVPSGDSPEATGGTSPRKSDAASTTVSPPIPLDGLTSVVGELPALCVHRGALPDLWQFSTPNRRVWAFLRSDSLLTRLRPVLAPDTLLADAEITLLPPDADNAAAFLTLSAGASLPGWRLALALKDIRFFDTTAEHRTAVYLWTGITVVAAMAILTLLAIRLLHHQVAFARLKNDLAATVSHELKTPLSSMRVLVDTLLDAARIEEQPVREYLQLIARENDRLSRVIENFLTFSRMERKKHTFDFAAVPPRRVIDTATSAVRERFAAPSCRFEVQVEENLPLVRADPDALATALINLLDNACKYSEDIKHVLLRVSAESGRVLFLVRDNGIGIATREIRRIFHPFHQIDPRLSRRGSGCGLGLSIVQNIVKAHDGEISVDSSLGCGSTFIISLPVAQTVMHTPVLPTLDSSDREREKRRPA